ncbi:hypothetical protein ACFYO9_29210 [Streptomyces sp. NPDC005863]|uniref:hypothetical protein n=1 Tax=unclassified Streptomyces TaxID=2593676 RepID=UPI0033CD388B
MTTTHVCAELMRRRYTTAPDEVGPLLVALRRSQISLDAPALYGDLEAVLGEHARPTPEEIEGLAARFRQTTLSLIQLVPYTVTPYPVDEMYLLTELRAERPQPRNAHRYILRFALAIVDVLDLMGDNAP